MASYPTFRWLYSWLYSRYVFVEAKLRAGYLKALDAMDDPVAVVRDQAVCPDPCCRLPLVLGYHTELCLEQYRMATEQKEAA